MTRLQNGQMFPLLEIPAVGGGVIRIPDSLAVSFGVVLIYRGAWCPYCHAQLAAFESATAKLGALGINVVAFSVDDEATTRGLVDQHRLSYSIGHSADANIVALATGASINEKPLYLQTTGFLLAPDGTIANAVYSSGPIGRLVPDDVAGMVAYLKSRS
jgi:peroxiredoxin